MNNEERASKVTIHLVQQVLLAIKKEEDIRGSKFVEGLYIRFLASLIGTATYQVLTDTKGLSVDEKKDIDLHVTKVGDFKRTLQDAVAAGFQTAMSKYSGKEMEYFCTIKLIPPAPSKLPS